MRWLLFFLFGLPLLSAQERSKRAKDAPAALHMLVPGFSVKTLPVQLKNAVNLQYRHDGKLVVLGYNGDIHLLTDTDADGLEDKATTFWTGEGKVTAPIGMDLAPAGSPHGQSVFFACKGKVMRVTDKDGDDMADEEQVIAEGWPLARAGIDTASLCYDARDHSILFGLGVRWYNNAYELDERGVAHNDLSSERGAILRIAPDLKSRTRLCTGVRWPIGLRFNALGDLFCTDQEGATWLPNGNPYDELLHIQQGRHYGFPPAHPRHLPSVVDEPSVEDYGPQHQSTCGLRFNEGVNGGPAFGPAFWKGDALVAGESRGKLYRTQLVQTEHGYVAHTSIIAALNQLTVDLTVSPRGDLLVATHSGEPDWGTGPQGQGLIFVVSYTDKTVPQPVLAQSLDEDRMALLLDRAAPPAASSSVNIQRGMYTRAGDAFETLWPGYEVIKLQHASPVTAVPVLSTSWTADRRQLVLQTAAQSAAETYSIATQPDYHTETALRGVAAQWQTAEGSEQRVTLPHLDTAVSAALLREHKPDLKGAQRLVLHTRLDLYGMLQPAVQPGASLDYEPQQEEVTLRISSPTSAFTVKYAAAKPTASELGQITHDSIFTHKPQQHQPLDLEITCEDATAQFSISWHTDRDKRERAMPLRRFLLPWCKPELTPGLAAPLPRPEIAGADWQRGRSLFFSERTLCSKCHAVRGKGALIGPDLSNLTSRSYASVLKDLIDPSAVLNPDHISHEVKLKDGRTLMAVLRDEGAEINRERRHPAGSTEINRERRHPAGSEDAVVLGMGPGLEERVQRSDIVSSTALKVSLMPPRLHDSLQPEEQRDLLAYLLTEPPVMGVYGAVLPPQRSAAELEAVLAHSERKEAKPLRLVLVSGKKDHGLGEHDYPRWRSTWARLFTLAEAVTVELAESWPSAAQWQSADAVVFHRKGDWDEARAKDMDTFLARGGGVTFIHWSLEAGTAAPSLAARIGFASNRVINKYRHGPVDLVFDPAQQHPITRGLTQAHFVDEMYWNLVPGAEVRTLATAQEAGAAQPQAWTRELPSGGRVFVTLGGHYSAVMDDPLYRVLLLRGIAWSAGESVDRFNKLVLAGLEQ